MPQDNPALHPNPGNLNGTEQVTLWRGNQPFGAVFTALTQIIVRNDPGANYTTQLTDMGKLIPMSSTANFTLSALMPLGYAISFVQINPANFISVVAGNGATIINVNGYSKSTGRGAIIHAVVYAQNAAQNAAAWVISGDAGP